MKSLLFQEGSPFAASPVCRPGRREVTVVLKKNGRFVTATFRDKVAIEDPYLTMVRAAAAAIGTGAPYKMQPPQRNVRNFLIRNNVVT